MEKIIGHLAVPSYRHKKYGEVVAVSARRKTLRDTPHLEGVWATHTKRGISAIFLGVLYPGETFTDEDMLRRFCEELNIEECAACPPESSFLGAKWKVAPR